MEISRVKAILDRQIECNMAIENEGIKNNYGANIGKTILKMNGSSDAKVRAKALAAAGSDAKVMYTDKNKEIIWQTSPHLHLC